MNKNEAINQAVKFLSQENDKDWTQAGEVAVEAIQAITRDESITRKEITEAIPELTRDTLISFLENEKKKEIDFNIGTSLEEVRSGSESYDEYIPPMPDKNGEYSVWMAKSNGDVVVQPTYNDGIWRGNNKRLNFQKVSVSKEAYLKHIGSRNDDNTEVDADITASEIKAAGGIQ